MFKHAAEICQDVMQIMKQAKGPWWEGKMFSHPTTHNKVKFKSLPIEEQRRLNALHKQKTDKKQEKQKLRLLRQKERQKRREEKRKLKEQRRKEKEETFRKMTPETHPNFFTSTGKRLDTRHGFRPGWKVEVNPDWDPKADNSYYAKEFNPKTGKASHYYTEDYMRRHDKIKFANVKRFGELLPKIRENYIAALTSPDSRDRAYATAISLVDQCAMRVGNKHSEEDDVRGLHSLLAKHMTIDGNHVKLEYAGKMKQAQKHEFDVSDSVKNNLQMLLKDKSPDGSIFTWQREDGKSIRISPRLVNRFLKRKLGSNVTIHKFRHHHATERAKSFLDNVDVEKMSTNDVKMAIKDASEYVAEYLGNTAPVARIHYIDPTIFQDFLKRANVKKSMEEVMKGAASDMMKKAGKYNFVFKVDDKLTGLTPEEQTFQDDIEAMKLEDLQPYEHIDFENTDPENLNF